VNSISSENKKKIQKVIHDKVFRIVSECGEELGKPVFVIGGYVRDVILGRSSKDIDFVIAGSGIALAELVAKKLKATKVSFFKTYGTAMIHHKGFDLEFVGARKSLTIENRETQLSKMEHWKTIKKEEILPLTQWP
jgi:poly(A) polymerase